jgi:hypothetical protein
MSFRSNSCFAAEISLVHRGNSLFYPGAGNLVTGAKVVAAVLL